MTGLIKSNFYRFLERLCCMAALLAAFSVPVQAHPHVFVDGRIDFVFADDAQLQSIQVTWLYDPFETLYVLSSLEINPGAEWSLTDKQLDQLVAHESNWSDSFNGAARLMQGGEPVALDSPTDFAVRLVNNRLEVRFTRELSQPQKVGSAGIHITFYEETYYFAFKIAKQPQLLGAANSCRAHLNLFDPGAQMTGLQTTLLELGREETPEDTTIGSLFTDRIHISCG